MIDKFRELEGEQVDIVIGGETYTGLLYNVTIEEPQLHPNDRWYVSGFLTATFVQDDNSMYIEGAIYADLGLGQVTAWTREDVGEWESEKKVLGEVHDLRGLDG